MSPAQVRAGTEADVARVVEIELAAETAPHWGADAYLRIVQREGIVRRCLVVAEAELVVGFAVGKVMGELGELESVAVLAEARGRGIGSALCVAVVDWLRDAGATVVELEVRAGSFGAQRMYQRMGFVAVGRRARYYSLPIEDAVLMRLELG